MVSVAYGQDLDWGRAYGLSNPFNSSSPPLTTSHVVKIASISKTFTDAMMLQLRDKGVVGLDDSVAKHLPGFSVKSPYSSNPTITLRQLASHTSGLPREVPCDWFKYSICTEKEILANLTNTYVLYPPYYRAHYSNLGIALLGRTLEKAAGVPYERYVEQNILQPLGMTRSGFTYSNIANYMAVGATSLPNGTLTPAPIEYLGWATPCGGMYASAQDMAKYIHFIFRQNATAGPNQPLSSDSVSEFLTTVSLSRDGASAFGIPWEFAYDNISKVYIRSKAGELLGFRSQVAVVPEIQLGIFIAASTDSLPDETSTAYTYPALTKILIPAFLRALDRARPAPPFPPNWKAFVGLYRISDGIFNSIDFQVFGNQTRLWGSYVSGTWTGDYVVFTEQIDNTTFRINLVDGDQLSCRWLDDGEDQEFIYFTLDSTGSTPIRLILMGQAYNFVSRTCPSC